MKSQKCFSALAILPLWMLLANSVAGAENPDSSQSRAVSEVEISSQATAALGTEMSSAGSRLEVPQVEVKAAIKNESDKDGTYFSLIEFDLIVEGKKDPRFFYGSVGLANSISEARQIAYKEWWAMFLPTFVRALTLSSEHVDEAGLLIYSSLIMCRGASPLPLNKDQASDLLSIVRPYLIFVRKNLNRGRGFLGDAHTLLLLMQVEQDGKTGGYCYYDGQTIPLSADAKSSGLPSTGAPYSLKQLFIFRQSKVAK